MNIANVVRQIGQLIIGAFKTGQHI